ncbi:MAG: PilN domain-containing protein [Thermodesulfovibrionia bacterium]|nr:PilN domain-containing protein [Thermodesulfovibrionia bacterium]MCK5286733.1 PilN domain-containing protein [Thermodesulfovibrionia bacterium]MCK5426693.1 PilN domain-containing protein [Thermodesulfovibrionia bacterium]
MIRINLLPEKRKKKVIELYSFIIRSALILGVVLLVLAVFTFYLIGKVSDLKEEKVAKEKRLGELQVLLAEVKNFETDNALFEQRTKVIEQLKKNQQVPVRLLEEVSASLPQGVWINRLKGAEPMMLQGAAFSNTDIVDYVQNLKRSQYLTDVTLVESQLKKYKEVGVYVFKINFRMKV